MNNVLNQTKLYTAGLFVLGCAIFSQCSKNTETVTPTPVAVPTIASFTPAEGIVGTVVTITGTNFSTTASTNKVTFLDANAARIPATVTAATATSITTTVPTGAVTGKIWVQVGDSTAKAATAFTVTPPAAAPTIVSWTPANAAVGGTVTITGTNFSTTASTNKVTFLGASDARISATVTVATATSITTTVPTGAVTGKIWVQVGDAIAKAGTAFTVDASATPATTYNNTIKAKLSSTCSGCHNASPRMIIGSTYTTDKSNAATMNTRIQNGTMPQGGPWSASDKALMQAWVDAGMPE